MINMDIVYLLLISPTTTTIQFFNVCVFVCVCVLASLHVQIDGVSKAVCVGVGVGVCVHTKKSASVTSTRFFRCLFVR